MISRGFVTVIDDLLLLEIAQYARDGIQLRERRAITTPPGVRALIKIADEIAASTSAYVSPVRNSAPTQEESAPEVDRLPPLITARQAAKILGDKTPHWARQLARQYGWIEQEVPIILMSRDAVIAHKLRRDEEDKCRQTRSGSA
jgi:hypothetical protein